MLYIGIDPGVHTGFAVWEPVMKRFEKVETTNFWAAIGMLSIYAKAYDITVIIEDPGEIKAVWHGKGANIKVYGMTCQKVGMVKAYARLMIEYCRQNQIPVRTVPPSQRTMTKLDADTFKKLTGYEGRTNEHNRDAALLVYGK